MVARGAFIGLLALGAAMLAGCGDSEPVEPGAGSARLEGRVALVKTAEGVPNAVVALLRDGQVRHVAATDADGRFSFEDVSAGTYIARLTGLELTGLDARYVSFEPLEQPVTVSGDPAELVFAGNGLVPPRVVGDITCGGSPMAGVTVRVVGGSFDRTVESNAQGRFSATNLGAGIYAVLLPEPPAACDLDAGYQVVELRAGQGVTIDFTG